MDNLQVKMEIIDSCLEQKKLGERNIKTLLISVEPRKFGTANYSIPLH